MSEKRPKLTKNVKKRQNRQIGEFPHSHTVKIRKSVSFDRFISGHKKCQFWHIWYFGPVTVSKRSLVGLCRASETVQCWLSRSWAAAVQWCGTRGMVVQGTVRTLVVHRGMGTGSLDRLLDHYWTTTGLTGPPLASLDHPGPPWTSDFMRGGTLSPGTPWHGSGHRGMGPGSPVPWF